MKYLITLSTLFVIGSVIGYIIEVFYRRLVTRKKWTNPGLMIGPYLPIYGFGTIILYQISSIDFSRLNVPKPFELMVVALTFLVLLSVLELVSGYIIFKAFNLRLWDYSNNKFNYKGLICARYSIYWMLVGITYYFALHPLFTFLTNLTQNSFLFQIVIFMFLALIIVDALNKFKFDKKVLKFATLMNKEVSNIIAYYNFK